jgi:hypothetical protein
MVTEENSFITTVETKPTTLGDLAIGFSWNSAGTTS